MVFFNCLLIFPQKLNSYFYSTSTFKYTSVFTDILYSFIEIGGGLKQLATSGHIPNERLINSGFYDLATAYQSMHINSGNRLVPNGMPGGMRGRELITPSHLIVFQIYSYVLYHNTKYILLFRPFRIQGLISGTSLLNGLHTFCTFCITIPAFESIALSCGTL